MDVLPILRQGEDVERAALFLERRPDECARLFGQRCADDLGGGRDGADRGAFAPDDPADQLAPNRRVLAGDRDVLRIRSDDASQHRVGDLGLAELRSWLEVKRAIEERPRRGAGQQRGLPLAFSIRSDARTRAAVVGFWWRPTRRNLLA